MPWVKGQSGNPSGKPKEAKTLSDALRNNLTPLKANRLAKRLIEMACDKKAPTASLAAIREIADRLEGKAVQAHKITSAMDEQTAKKLIELAQIMGVEEDTTSDPQPTSVN